VLALLRLINPRAEIRAAAGREGHLRGLESLALWPANSIFVEGYLTTQGEGIEATYAKIREAGFEIEGNSLSDALSREESASPDRYQLPNLQGDSILKPSLTKTELRS
ncbi:MAG: biotin synthase BioB, partial [Deltaproteobacteria bacterium]|nr:biotin synthase BioB [Deltaproteobacteria bacterium]